MQRTLLILTAALAFQACAPCVTRHVANANGEWHRIAPYLLARYGCPSFQGVQSADDMLAWCRQQQLGDTISADVLPECSRRGTLEGCEWFWVCE